MGCFSQILKVRNVSSTLKKRKENHTFRLWNVPHYHDFSIRQTHVWSPIKSGFIKKHEFEFLACNQLVYNLHRQIYLSTSKFNCTNSLTCICFFFLQ